MSIQIKKRGLCNYQTTLEAMQKFTNNRDKNTKDELWLLEHYSVFTQGQAGKEIHVLDSGNIPVIQSDRGGQVTYHGPGQLVLYTLIDLKRKKLGIRSLVTLLENAVIDLLQHYHISAYREDKAPGVYINKKKICSLGLRVKKGCSYHGLALNTHMDLAPFKRIEPCGYNHLEMTQLSDYQPSLNIKDVEQQLIDYTLKHLGKINNNYIS